MWVPFVARTWKFKKLYLEFYFMKILFEIGISKIYSFQILWKFYFETIEISIKFIFYVFNASLMAKSFFQKIFHYTW